MVGLCQDFVNSPRSNPPSRDRKHSFELHRTGRETLLLPRAVAASYLNRRSAGGSERTGASAYCPSFRPPTALTNPSCLSPCFPRGAAFGNVGIVEVPVIDQIKLGHSDSFIQRVKADTDMAMLRKKAGSGMSKSLASSLQPTDFGNFTRGAIVELIGRASQGSERSDSLATVAATYLAIVSDHDRAENRHAIENACDLIATSGTVFSTELLWQITQHAEFKRIRVEAIRRCGPSAIGDRRALLRKWTSEGFVGGHDFQNDQVTLDGIKEAGLQSLGHVPSPEEEDSRTIFDALMSSAKDDSSRVVLEAASDAYGRIGNKSSLPEVVALAGQVSGQSAHFLLASLAARFSPAELRPHAEAIRRVLSRCADPWPSNSSVADRLVTLAVGLATPVFLNAWVSQYGRFSPGSPQASITTALLKKLRGTDEETTNAVLSLVRFPPWAAGKDSPAVERLIDCIKAGRSGQVRRRLVEGCDGYTHLVQSGEYMNLFRSADVALAEVCEAITSLSRHSRPQVAEAFATGALVWSIQHIAPEEPLNLITRFVACRDPWKPQNQVADLWKQRLEALDGMEPDKNSVTVVARLLTRDKDVEGAIAVAASWLTRNECLAAYVIRTALREAGRLQVGDIHAAGLRHFEDFVLTPQQQRQLAPILKQAAPEMSVVDGRLNLYVLDMLCRHDFAFASHARVALAHVETIEEATFVLDRLVGVGSSAVDVLLEAGRFHREGKEELTEGVRIHAIESVTRVARDTKDDACREKIAGALQESFSDMHRVRIVAYRACGSLLSLRTIRPLCEHSKKEPDPEGRSTIAASLTALEAELMCRKPSTTADSRRLCQWLDFATDLAEPRLLPHVIGYLVPAHKDKGVCLAAYRRSVIRTHGKHWRSIWRRCHWVNSWLRHDEL
jgi:hypothetical protein